MFLDSFLSQASVASCFLGLIFFLLPTLSSPYYIPFFLNQAKKALVIVLPVHRPNFLINTSSAGSPLRHFIFVPSIYTDQLLEGLQTQPAVWKLVANSMQCYHSVYLAVCTAGISLCVLYSLQQKQQCVLHLPVTVYAVASVLPLFCTWLLNSPCLPHQTGKGPHLFSNKRKTSTRNSINKPLN